MRLKAGRKEETRPSSKSTKPPGITPATSAPIIGFALLMDLLSSIPIIGVAFNLIASSSIYIWTKTRGLDRGRPWFVSFLPWLGGGLESIVNVTVPPLAALLPSFTLTVLSIILINSSWGRRFIKILSPI